CPPDVGFILTGNVQSQEGFVISWVGGWLRGCASGCILHVDFDKSLEDAKRLQFEIEGCLKGNNT
ncbi:MAG: hypothetical protein MI861_01260, partial [Pirellulales bacterium]|nr:hypothetical protein [Pirellulales bacterium]